MEMSQKEESILTLFKELSEKEEMGKDFDLNIEDVLQTKNDGVRNFINMIVSTESYPITIPDGFLESADSDFLDNFMSKFIGSN